MAALPGLKMAVTRRVPGAICLSTSTHLVPSENSNTENPVMFPPFL